MPNNRFNRTTRAPGVANRNRSPSLGRTRSGITNRSRSFSRFNEGFQHAPRQALQRQALQRQEPQRPTPENHFLVSPAFNFTKAVQNTTEGAKTKLKEAEMTWELHSVDINAIPGRLQAGGFHLPPTVANQYPSSSLTRCNKLVADREKELNRLYEARQVYESVFKDVCKNVKPMADEASDIVVTMLSEEYSTHERKRTESASTTKSCSF